jgi:hypothetical protein
MAPKNFLFSRKLPLSIQKGEGNKVPGIILGSYIMPVTSDAYKEDNSEAEKIWYSVQLIGNFNSCMVEHEVTLNQLELRVDEHQTSNQGEDVELVEKIHEDSSQQIPTSISIVEEPNHNSIDNEQQTISLDEVVTSPSLEVQTENIDSDVLSVEEVPNKDKPCDPNDPNKNHRKSEESSKPSELKSSITRKRQRSQSPEKKCPPDMDPDKDRKQQPPRERLSDILARIPRRKQCGRSISPSPLRQDRHTHREKHDSASKFKLRTDERSKERREDERHSKSLEQRADHTPGASNHLNKSLKPKNVKKSISDRIYDAPYQYSVTIEGFDREDYMRNVVGAKGVFHRQLLRDLRVRWIKVIEKSIDGPFVLLGDFDDKIVKNASENLVRWVEKRADSRVRSKIVRYN